MNTSYSDIIKLRPTPGQEINAEFSDFTHAVFDTENGFPVLIPTFEEEDDLPLALVALSRSSVPVHPIVVDSGSKDRTQEFADNMGATVITIGRGQMLGYKVGIEFVQRTRHDGQMIITDADCLPQKRWVETMTSRNSISPVIGGVAFGTTVFFNGPSKLTDITRSLYAIGGDIGRTISKSEARPRGSNCYIRLDTRGVLHKAISGQEDQAWGCDLVLNSAVQEAGGQTDTVLHPNAVTLSNGDRYSSLSQLAKILLLEKTGRGSRKELYADHGFVTVVEK